MLNVERYVESDTFVFHFNKFIDLAKALYATKRNILKVSASFYDFISPVTARVKFIFEVLCKDSYEWDEKVNNEIKNIKIIHKNVVIFNNTTYNIQNTTL